MMGARWLEGIRVRLAFLVWRISTEQFRLDVNGVCGVIHDTRKFEITDVS